MKNILMATDLSARSDRALERAVNLAREHGASLLVAHIIDSDLPEYLAEAQKKAAEQILHGHLKTLTAEESAPSSIQVQVDFGRAFVDILDLSDKTEADLIVLGTHREDTLKDMFRGTTAERVIRAAEAPVLLVKERYNAPYRKIMVGIDFSVYSRRAIEFAIRFAPKSQFHLIHAYDVPFRGFLSGDDTQKDILKQHQAQFQKMIEHEMATFLTSLEPNAPQLERVLQQGTVWQVIHDQISKIAPDVLVIGTHGRTGVPHAVLGSVAEDLLERPPCDVLAVNAW
ncbi:MAG: universal stress protein [Rhodospirillaceae bacterium]